MLRLDVGVTVIREIRPKGNHKSSRQSFGGGGGGGGGADLNLTTCIHNSV